MEITNSIFYWALEEMDWRAASYFSENKRKIPSISYSEVQSDLQDPLHHTT